MSRKSIVARSPGRINIIGEHTDYNDGYVLPAAINMETTFHLQTSGDKDLCQITADDLAETYTFDLRDFSPLSSGWQNYVMGVIHEIQTLAGPLPAMQGHFASTVPIGSGLSSSAALECSLAWALNEMLSLQLDNWQLIKASQRAEHHFVGMKCGIMDQFASVMGKAGHVMLLDCRSLEFKYFPLDLGAYELLLLNSHVTHDLASSAYNRRREECEQGVESLQAIKPDISSLRDATLDDLQQIQAKITDEVYRRCLHVIDENQRVLDATRALQAGDLATLGQLMYSSHHSLSKHYEVSCPEMDFLVDLARNEPGVLGSRMMGGGFGGCTISLVKKSVREAFVHKVTDAFRENYGITPTPYTVQTANGTSTMAE